MRIQLGDLVEDTVSGFKGIVTSRTEWLHGCVRLQVQPQGTQKEKGIPHEASVFDEPQLKLIKAGAVPSTATALAQEPEPAKAPRRYGDRDDSKALQR